MSSGCCGRRPSDEQERFLAGRLRLPFVVDATEHFEIVDRTFAALPPETLSLLRILRVRAHSSDESRLIATLRRPAGSGSSTWG